MTGHRPLSRHALLSGKLDLFSYLFGGSARIAGAAGYHCLRIKGLVDVGVEQGAELSVLFQRQLGKVLIRADGVADQPADCLVGFAERHSFVCEIIRRVGGVGVIFRDSLQHRAGVHLHGC